MSDAMSEAARRLVDDVATGSGLEPRAAAIATTLVADFLATTLTAHRLEDLRRHVAAFDEVAAEGARHAAALAAGTEPTVSGSLAGRLFASVGGLIGGDEGGPVSRAMVLLGNLGRVGVGVGDVGPLTDAMIAHVRRTDGDAWVDAMSERVRSKFPAIARLVNR